MIQLSYIGALLRRKIPFDNCACVSQVQPHSIGAATVVPHGPVGNLQEKLRAARLPNQGFSSYMNDPGGEGSAHGLDRRKSRLEVNVTGAGDRLHGPH